MTTLAVMKARIARETRRNNIPDDIADAINTAIAEYQAERFYFSETRATFNTIAGQEFYGAADVGPYAATIASIVKFDYVKLLQGDLPWTLKFVQPERIETINANGTNQGQPLMFCYYAEQLRFYPIPNGVFPIVIGCQAIPAAPQSDDETGNPWMTKAETLIRARAKWELALHRLYDDALATRMSAAVTAAKDTLKGRTNALDQQGGWGIIPVQF